MSSTILERLKAHIIDDGSLLSGYSLRYYRWRDVDLSGSGDVVLFRMTGTFGPVNRVTQQNDVSLFLLADSDKVKQADLDMLGVLQYLRANYETTGIHNMMPLGSYEGPSYMQNGRAMFEMVVRVGTEDH